MRAYGHPQDNGEFVLELRFECQEEVQSFRNLLRHNTGLVIDDWRGRDPLANARDCHDVMDAIGVALYGEQNVPPPAVAAIPRRPVSTPPAIRPYAEGAPGTLTFEQCRVGMLVRSCYHESDGTLFKIVGLDQRRHEVTLGYGDGFGMLIPAPAQRMYLAENSPFITEELEEEEL